MARPLGADVLTITKDTIYEVPPLSNTEITYLSFFNTGSVTQTVNVYFSFWNEVTRDWGPNIQWATWNLTFIQSAQAIERGTPPTLGPRDRLIAVTTSVASVDWALMGNEVRDA